MPLLARNKHLHSLNLSQTAVTNKGLQHLASTSQITSLILDGCSNLQRGLPGLQALPELAHLSLSVCRQLSPYLVLGSLQKASGLTHLNLAWCQGAAPCELREVHALSKLTGLRTLLLDNAALPAKAFQGVLSLPHLTSLGASGFAFPAAEACLSHAVDKLWGSSRPEGAAPADDDAMRLSSSSLSLSDELDMHVDAESGTIAAEWQALSTSTEPLDEIRPNRFDGPAPLLPHCKVSAQPSLTNLSALTLRWSNVWLPHAHPALCTF
jgi:hypothetical protein